MHYGDHSDQGYRYVGTRICAALAPVLDEFIAKHGGIGAIRFQQNPLLMLDLLMVISKMTRRGFKHLSRFGAMDIGWVYGATDGEPLVPQILVDEGLVNGASSLFIAGDGRMGFDAGNYRMHSMIVDLE